MRSRFKKQNRKFLTVFCVIFMALSTVASFIILNEKGLPSASANDADRGVVPLLEHKITEPRVTDWRPIPEFHALFQNEKGEPTPIDKDSSYWISDSFATHVSGVVPQNKVGKKYPIMMRNTYNDVNGVTESQTVSAAMYLTPTTALPANRNPFVNLNIFSSQAIGRFGGDLRNPDGAYSLFVWSWNGGLNVNGLMCENNPSTTNNSLFTPVIRFDDYPPDADPHDPTHSTNVFWTCMPTPGGADAAAGGQFGYPARGMNQATGGEINQITGQLYIAGATSGHVINGLSNRTTPNDGGVVYSIWDPVENTYSLSGPVQANDFSKGQTKPPLEQLAVSIARQHRQTASCTSDSVFELGQKEYQAACRYSNAGLQASPDMGLDAEGNFFIYGQVSGTNSIAADVMVLLKITPATDYSGGSKKILDGSLEHPWRYSLVTRVREGDTFKPTGSMPPANYAVGAAVHNGKLLLTGYMNLVGNFNFPPNGSSTQPTTALNYPIKIDPLSGNMDIIYTYNNGVTLPGTTQKTEKFAIAIPFGNNTLTDVVSLPVSNGVRDAASAQEFMTIQGNVYNDVQANGDFAGFKKSELQGYTINLYDDKGKLVGTTKTSADGSYSFVIGSKGTYFVRLVQPQVDKVNAFQTWARVRGGSGGDKRGRNDPVVVCANGNVTDASGDAGGKCQGAQSFPYVDPNPPLRGSKSMDIGKVDPAWNDGKPLWGTYAKVEVRTSYQSPVVDFAVSTGSASYGDASGSVFGNVGPFNTTRAQKGPSFNNPNAVADIYQHASGLQLGDKLGVYPDGTPDYKAHSLKKNELTGLSHVDTDDGVEVVLPSDPTVDVGQYCSVDPVYKDIQVQKIQGLSLVAGRTYCVRAKVSGELAKSDAAKGAPSVVLGWQSPPAPNKDGGWTKVQSELASVVYAGNKADGTGDIAQTYSTLKVPSLFNSAISPVQARFVVVSNSMWKSHEGNPSDLMQSKFPVDNVKGAYNGPVPFTDAADTEYFVSPGEVEDYQYYSSNFSFSIVAKLSDGVSGNLSDPVTIKYNLDSRVDDPSTNTDSITLGVRNSGRTSSEHLPKLDVDKADSSIIFTTGTPSIKLQNKSGKDRLIVSDRQKPSCKGSYVGKSGTVRSYDVALEGLSDDSLVPQPSDQQSIEKTNVSYKVNTNFKPPIDVPVASGFTVVCTVTYDVHERPDALPEAGSSPWQKLATVGFVIVGVLLGSVYVVRWCKEHGYLDKNNKNHSSNQ